MFRIHTKHVNALCVRKVEFFMLNLVVHIVTIIVGGNVRVAVSDFHSHICGCVCVCVCVCVYVRTYNVMCLP